MAGNKSQLWRGHIPPYLTAIIALILFVTLWQWLAGFYEAYILPSPVEVYQRLKESLGEGGSLAVHFLVTCAEAFSGFLIACAGALPLSYYMYRHPALDRLLTPYIVGIQAVPIVALAPLLVIWFGFGPTSKILIAALVAFFPVLTNGIIGLREVNPGYKELLMIMGASRRDLFFKLEIPSALPVICGGLKMGLTLSVIGAVVGEFSGAGKGLGYLINLARGSFDTALIFIALIALALLGIGFYSAISVLEYLAMPWKRKR